MKQVRIKSHLDFAFPADPSTVPWTWTVLTQNKKEQRKFVMQKAAECNLG